MPFMMTGMLFTGMRSALAKFAAASSETATMASVWRFM